MYPFKHWSTSGFSNELIRSIFHQPLKQSSSHFKNRLQIITVLLSLLWSGLGCGLSQVIVTPTTIPIIPTAPFVVPPPTPEISAAAIPPTSTPIPPDTGWLTHQPGLEQRTITLFDATGQRRESVTILRLDPAYFTFDIGYRPGQPQTLPQWQAETGAQLVVNGGYFTEEQIATGLIIVDGVTSGWSYEGFGGMVVITAAGLEVRSLVEQPYDATESIAAALQSFPLLVKPGGEPGFPEEDFRASRRTVIAQDTQGRLLFLVAPLGYFTLYQLSQWLSSSDLDIQIALNLDGGASTGLLLTAPLVHIASFDLLPVVITASPSP